LNPDLLEAFYLEARAGINYTRTDWRKLSDEERVARVVAMDRLEQERLGRLAAVILDPVLAVSPLDGGRLARTRVLQEMVERRSGGASSH
jgi:hypothetical protein